MNSAEVQDEYVGEEVIFCLKGEVTATAADTELSVRVRYDPPEVRV